MPKLVEIPSVGVVSFPDLMTDQEVAEASEHLHKKAGIEAQQQAAAKTGRRAAGVAGAIEAAESVAGRVSLGGLSRLARAAATDVVTPGVPQLPIATTADLMGQPTPPQQELAVQQSAVRSGLVGAAGAVPMVGASMALMTAGVPPIVAMAAPAGVQTFEETRDWGQTGKATFVAGLIPPVGAVGRTVAAKALSEGIARGYLSGGATGAQKAVEALAGQTAIQALMEGVRIPEYLEATPEQRRFMLVESLIANSVMGVPDAVTALRPGPSMAQTMTGKPQALAGALRQALRDPVLVEQLQRQVDESLVDHATGADWAREFVPRPDRWDRPKVPPPPLVDPGQASPASVAPEPSPVASEPLAPTVEGLIAQRDRLADQIEAPETESNPDLARRLHEDFRRVDRAITELQPRGPMAPPKPPAPAEPQSDAWNAEIDQYRLEQLAMEKAKARRVEESQPGRKFSPERAARVLNALREEGVSHPLALALIRGEIGVQEAVEKQMGVIRRPGGGVDASTIIVEERPDGGRDIGFTPEAGPAAAPPSPVGQMSHQDAIQLARDSAIERVEKILGGLTETQEVPKVQTAPVALSAPEPSPVAPEPARQGEVGGKLGSGEVVRTASGRLTTPFPTVDTATDRKTQRTLREVERWLMDNAIAEAKARRDEFNARQFEHNRNNPSQADKDSAEEYLFGKQPAVSAPLLKPISRQSPVTPEPAPSATATEAPPIAWYIEPETERFVVRSSKEAFKQLPAHIQDRIKRYFIFSPRRGGWVSKGIAPSYRTQNWLEQFPRIDPPKEGLPPKKAPAGKPPEPAPAPEPPPKFDKPPEPAAAPAGGSANARATQAYPGGPIGSEPAPAPADNPSFTQLPIEMPEAVRFVRDLLGGKYPRVVEAIRALRGRALGVFRHADATGEASIELRADIFDLLTPAEKEALRRQAQAYAEDQGTTPDEINRIARERYDYLLEQAYEEAKTKPPLMALKVLWHEIGHLVDWLPQHMISGRGNLFGRIASLRDYLRNSIPLEPGGQDRPITPADRERLRRQAEKEMRDELGPMREILQKIMVEEPIYREAGVTADMVKQLFGMEAREKMPDLYRWFAEQPAEVKKEIVKKAMKGMVDERIQRIGGREQIGTRMVERTVRQRMGREPTQAEIAQRFRELLRREMEARRMVDLDTVKAELRPLIAWWRGTKEMEPYFKPSEEMYAEAFSVFINNPAAVARRAPTYYRMMHSYMELKPEVKRLYEEIQDQIRSGTIMRERVEELRASWRRDNERSLAAWRAKFTTAARDFLDNVLYHYDRRFGPVYRAAQGTSREGRVREAVGNFLYRATEHERFLGQVNERVGGALVANNLDWHDLGEYLFHQRVIEERYNLANPMGWASKNSIERMRELEATLGPERWRVLETAAKEFRKIYEDQVIPLMREARLWGPELQRKIDENVFYATFAAVRRLPDTGIERAIELSLGPGVTPHIYRQIGHLGEIKNPATATVLKALSLMSAAHRNMAKREIVAMLRAAHPEEIMPAKRRWNGRFLEAVPMETDRVGTITYLEDGKPVSWYVPRLIAESVNYGSPIESRLAAAMVNGLNWQKALFTQHNYGFWPVNFLRDTADYFLKMPGTVGLGFAWLRNLPRALRAARAMVRGRTNPDADAALRRLMVISREDPRGVLSDVADEYELKLAGYGLNPAQWSREEARVWRAIGAWQRYRGIGQVLERVNKIQGMLYLDQKFPGMPEGKKREIVRERAGSPDFLEKGASNWHADLVMLFFNAWKQGLRATVRSAKENPWSFAAKSLVGVAAPSALMAAAQSGVLGEDLKEAYRSIPDYDLTNYFVLPLGWADRAQGKVAYFRIPLPEPMRLMHGTLFRLLTGRGEGYAAFYGGQLPGLNPMLQAIGAWVQYSMGHNPVDLHTGRPIVEENQFEAGGAGALKQMGAWTWNSLGGGLLHRFRDAQLESAPTTGSESLLRAPILSNLVGRWIRVSDRGRADEDRRLTEPVRQYRAQVRLAVRALLDRWAQAGVLEGKGQVPAAAALAELTPAEQTLIRDPYAMDYLLELLPTVVGSRSSDLLRRLGQLNSRAEKEAVIQAEAERIGRLQAPLQSP